MNAPLVSIITPAYHADPFIVRTVGSVLAQTHSDWEMIIISDDGQDYKQFLLNQGINDKRLRFVFSGGVATGPSHARNIGLDAAAGDIIAMLDADDIFHPEKLARMLPKATEHGMCLSAFNEVRYENGKRIVTRSFAIAQDDVLLAPESLLRLYHSTHSLSLFDRRRMQARWPEELRVTEDQVFTMRAFEYLPAIYHMNEPLHDYVYSPHSLSNSSAASGHFITAKKMVLDRLSDGGLGIHHPDSVAAFRAFIQLSLEAEYDYVKASLAQQPVSFIELLRKRLPQEWD